MKFWPTLFKLVGDTCVVVLVVVGIIYAVKAAVLACGDCW